MIGPEDMVIYDQNTVIVSSTDRLNLDLLHGPSQTPQGQMFAIYNAESLNPQVQLIKLINFPVDINFYPHGMYLSESGQLFVINHAYGHGGERVEVFDIKIRKPKQYQVKNQKNQNQDINLTESSDSEIELEEEDNNANLKIYIRGLVYQYSIFFDKQYNGILNDLAVISNNQLLITKFLPYADDVNGRPYNSKINGEITHWKQMFGIKSSYVLSCKYSPNAKAKCTQLDQTASSMNNGINWNDKDTVIVSNTFEGKMTIYKLVQDEDNYYDENEQGQNKSKKKNISYQLIQSEELLLSGHPDNIEYDRVNDKFYVGVFGRIKDLFNYEKQAISQKRIPEVEQWAGIEEIACLEDKCEYKTLFMSNHSIKACSAAVKINHNIILGSWSDKSVVVCRDNKGSKY